METIRARVTLPGAVDHEKVAVSNRAATFLMFDGMSDLADYAERIALTYSASEFVGNIGAQQAIAKCRDGDLNLAAASDRYLDKMASHELATARRTIRDDVAGAFPNVPAFIAGHPLSMRRRHREEAATAPLAIIVDLTTSGGIADQAVRTRGAALLALVRALSTRRPVELWACAGLNKGSGGAFAVVRIETAPLDLARAAFALTHTAMSRGILYETLQHSPETQSSGAWPFMLRGPMDRAQMQAVFAPAMSHVTETLCLPGLCNTDEAVTNPEAWLTHQIATHGAVNLDDAA